MVTRRYGVADIDKFVEQYKPFTIGFDRLFDNLTSVSEIANNYPPYNIVKQDDENFIIEIAAAGFRSCQSIAKYMGHTRGSIVYLLSRWPSG